jgi:hypothetical protein
MSADLPAGRAAADALLPDAAGHTFDFSRNAGFLQRLIFALWGAMQLMGSALAFQRGGFAYGLLVLLGGLLLFCGGVFFLHRFHRYCLTLRPDGLYLEQGLSPGRHLSWASVAGIRLWPEGIILAMRNSPEEKILFAEWDEAKSRENLPRLLERLERLAAARGIPVDKPQRHSA